MVTNNSSNIPTGASTTVLQGQGVGTAPAFSTATYPATTTSQQILYSTAANVVGQLTTANSALAATNSSGTLAMRALSVNIQVFTSTGTYTPTSGMLYCVIECGGGGGGGGGTGNSGATASAVGGGGGGGAYSRKFASAATIGASQTVTIPNAAAGGTAGNNAGASPAATTVGTICTANGGSGGAGNTGSGSSAGGAGGTAGTGDFSVPGEAGGSTISAAITSVIIPYGVGGASCLGFGGPPIVATGAVTGNAGQLYGGGGGGGSSFGAAGTAAGGAGGKGIVIITEYIIA